MVDELHDDRMANRWGEALTTVLDTGELHYRRRSSMFEERQLVLSQRIMATLADDTGRIVRFVGCHNTAGA